MKRKDPPDFKALARKAAQRSALNALRKTRRAADKAGIKLSDWEGEFLGSVEDRVKTYGRAFGDPELGAPGQALSAMQARKLKEIAAKAQDKAAQDKGPKDDAPRKPGRAVGGLKRRGRGSAGPR